MENSIAHELWLGFSSLNVDYRLISAIVRYQTEWDRRIIQAHGTLPGGVRSVVLLEDGRALPSRRSVDDLNQQWYAWRAEHDS